MRIRTWLSLLGIFACGLLFSLLNPTLVSFDYFFGQQEMALSLLLTGVFLIGLFLGFSLMTFVIWREKHRVRVISKQLNQVQKEVENLRNLAIIGD